MWVFLNDRFVEKAQARISVFDHGFLYGDGVYETVRAYQGRIFLLTRHLARLRQSCELIGLALPVKEEDWISIMSGILTRNYLTDAGIRLTISRGEGELGIDPDLCSHPTVVVLAKPFVAYPDHLRAEGVRLQVVSIRRNHPSTQSPQIKSLSFLNNILAKQEAKQAGVFDALMLNMDDQVTECTTSNIFFVANQRLLTPSVACGILAGITREVVIELAGELGIEVEEGKYSVQEVLQADECFITNTGLEIMAVSHIGTHPIGQGIPGPLTRKLWQAFQQNLGRFLGPCLTTRQS
jgi:branched-chain amino acid aminotransferase